MLRSPCADRVEIVLMTTAGRLGLRPSCQCGIGWMGAAGVCVCVSVSSQKGE